MLAAHAMSLPKLYLETTIPNYLATRWNRDLRLAARQEVILPLLVIHALA